LAIACVLDPRCKLDVVEYYIEKIYDPRCKLDVVEYYIEKIYADDECSRFIANLNTNKVDFSTDFSLWAIRLN
jgi:Domain of unknown function (DUF4413)